MVLKRKRLIELNHNKVQRILQNHLQCRVKPKRQWESQGESVIIAPNLLQLDFRADKPNQKWVTDITYLQYGPSTLLLSTVLRSTPYPKLIYSY